MKKIIAPLAVSLLILTVLKIGEIQNPIYILTNDFYIRAYQASKNPGEPNEKIVIVNISDFPTEAIKDQVEILSLYEPAVIGIDYLAEGSFNIDSTIGFKNTVLPMLIEDNQIDYAKNFFSDTSYYGSVSINSATYFTPFTKIEENIFPSFASKIIELYNPKLYNAMRKRNLEKEVINYNGNIYQFYFLGDLLNVSPGTLDSVIKDKVVLLGYTGINSPLPTDLDEEDVHETPVSYMYGVVLMANIIHTLMDNYITPLNTFWSVIIVMVLAYLNTLASVILFNNRLNYLLIKTAQVLQIIVLFCLSSLIIYNFQVTLDFEVMTLSVILAPELTFWYLLFMKKT